MRTYEERKAEVFGLLDKAFADRGLSKVKCDRLKHHLDKRAEGYSNNFFTAPASTKYHSSYEGGLCDHSLNVCYNLMNLVKMKGLTEVYPEHSLIIVALMHDISKMNFYEEYFKNEKQYSETGSKYDEHGHFDWVSKKAYKTKDVEDRFVYGNHEENSEYMARHYIDLTLEESVAILNHHAGMGYDSTQADFSAAYNKYPLAALLHLADMIATYVDERV